MPSQTFSHRTMATVPVEVVWAALEKPETWEAIGGVDRVFDPRVDETGRLQGFSFDTVAAGKRYVGNATPRERIDGRRLGWNIENSEIRGTTTVDVAPFDTGHTAITVTLEVESAGFLSSMFFPVIAGAIGNGLPRAVDEFAAALSSQA